MSKNPRVDEQLIRGLLDTLVMAVIEEGPNYGFGIIEALEKRLGDESDLVREGTLYPLLHRLNSKGFLASHLAPGDRGRPRRYYRLTPEGRDFLAARRAEWRRIARVLRTNFLDSDPGVPNGSSPTA